MTQTDTSPSSIGNWKDWLADLAALLYFGAIIFLLAGFHDRNIDPESMSMLAWALVLLPICLLVALAAEASREPANDISPMIMLVAAGLAANAVAAFVFFKFEPTMGCVLGGGCLLRLEDAVYVSVSSWTTLGSGNVQPSPELRIFTAFHGLTGYLFAGVFVAILFRRPEKGLPTRNMRYAALVQKIGYWLNLIWSAFARNFSKLAKGRHGDRQK